MDNLNHITDELLIQQQQARQRRYQLHKKSIKTLLSCVDYHELIEMIDSIYAEEYAKSEIATARTMQ